MKGRDWFELLMELSGWTLAGLLMIAGIIIILVVDVLEAQLNYVTH